MMRSAKRRRKIITAHNVSPELAALLARKAREQGTSVSRTVLQLLEESLRPRTRAGRKFRDLSMYAGGWSKDEAEAFDRRLAEMRQIDPEMWK